MWIYFVIFVTVDAQTCGCHSSIVVVFKGTHRIDSFDF